MRAYLVALLALIPGGIQAHELIRWPDAEIAIPTDVGSFIVSECYEFRGTSEEDISACIEGEGYGYRATIGMLTDAATGERAAELYRACQAGLGADGGRFHRRRAECIGTSLGFVWRFEFTRKAEVESLPPGTKFAEAPHRHAHVVN